MAHVNFVTDHHADQALRVPLRDRQFARIRLKAPDDAPYSPGPWIPTAAGDVPTGLPTEDWSCGMWVDDNVTNPDVATASTGKDNTYSVAWIESTPNTTSPDELYYEIGLTSFESAVLTQGVPAEPDMPNRRGPEVQTTAAGITWHIHGLVNFEALSETDPGADQLDDVVLTFALVPDSLVTNSGLSWAPHQYEFKVWPTATVLAGLTVLHTQTLSRAGLTWSNGRTARFAEATLELDLLIPAALITGGRAHVVYWLEQSDGRRYFDTTYVGTYTSTVPNTWAAVPDGPLSDELYAVSGNGSVFGYYGANDATAGYWQKSNGDEIYLASSGSAPGSRYGYSGTLRNGYLPGDRDIVFTFSQVTTNDFGAAVMVNPFSRAIIITPTQIIDQAVEARTALDTHDTPFVSGDVCEVRIRGLVVEVWRAGVMVSTATVPSEVTTYYYYTFYWALTANTGNRIANWHTIAPPTNRGLTGVLVELSESANPSTAEGIAATAYRYSYADGYPKPFLEYWLQNDGTNNPHQHATMWIKLEPNAPTASTWMGSLSPEVTDSPGMNPADIPAHNAPDAFIAFRREDGELLTRDVTDDVISNDSYVALPWTFLDESKGLIQFGGFDGPYAAHPESVVPVSGAYDFYLRLDLGSTAYAQPWWDEPWRDYLLYPINRSNPGTPLIWHWEEGDDHNGYQGIGYAHNTAPLTTSIPVTRAGVALLVQDTTEGYDYGWKDEIIGYTEQDGPFYYGPLSPGAYHGSWDWEDWITETYGQAIASDQGGAILAALNYGQGRTGYHPTQYWLDSDNFMIDGSPHYSFMFSNYLHGSSATNNSVSWYSSHIDGLRLNTSPSTTVDTLYQDYLYYAHDFEEPDLIYSMSVQSAWAGMYIRGDVSNTKRWAVNNTQLLKIDDTTRTVMASWAERPANTVMHLKAVGDTVMVLADGVVVAEVTDAFNRHEVGLGLWCRKGSGDAARWNIVSLWSAGPLPGFWINGDNQDGLVSLTRAWSVVQDRGRTVEPEVVWPTENRVTLDNGSPQPHITVFWSVWSPVYPDSLFVLLQLQYWPGAFVSYISGEGIYSYRQFEIDKNTGAIIREMIPFLDPSVDPANSSQMYEAANYNTMLSADGTQLRAVFYYHNTVEQIYDLATETIISRPVPSGLRQYLGALADGRELWGQDFYHDSSFSLWDPVTATRQDIDFGSYVGRGYNGGINGWDGERYLWGGFLNYHTEPSAYILTADDIARIPTGVVHSYVVGDTVSVGNGIAQAFTEFVRYDLLAAGTVSGPPHIGLYNIDGSMGTDYWDVPAQTASVTLSSPGNGLNASVTGEVDFNGEWSIRVWSYVSPTDKTYKITAHMQSFGGGSYGRIKVEQFQDFGGGSMVLLRTTETSPSQILITAGGFVSDVVHSFDTHPDANFMYITIIWQMASPSALNPYGIVTLDPIVTNDGAIPVEYMFNLDHEVAQGYAYAVTPRIDSVERNLFTHHQWAGDTTSDFTPGDDVSGRTPATLVGTSTGLQATTNTTEAAFGLFWVNPARVDIDTVYGIYNYYWISFQVRKLSGSSFPDPNLRWDIRGYDAADTTFEGGLAHWVQTPVALASLGSDWTHVQASARIYPASARGVAKLGLEFSFYGGLDDPTVLEFRHFNLLPGFSSRFAEDHDPAEGDALTVTGWSDMGDGAIEYRFPNFSFPASFAPPGGNAQIGAATTGAKFVPNA